MPSSARSLAPAALLAALVASCAIAPPPRREIAARSAAALDSRTPPQRFTDGGARAIALSAARSRVHALPLPSGRILIDGYGTTADQSDAWIPIPADLVDPFEGIAEPASVLTPVAAPAAAVVLGSGRVLSLGRREASVWDPETGELFERIIDLPEDASDVYAIPPQGGRDRAIFTTRGKDDDAPCPLYAWTSGQAPTAIAGTEVLRRVSDLRVEADGALVVRAITVDTPFLDPPRTFAYDATNARLVPYCDDDAPPACTPRPAGFVGPGEIEGLPLLSGDRLYVPPPRFFGESAQLAIEGPAFTRALPLRVPGGAAVRTATGGALVYRKGDPEALLVRPDVHPAIALAGNFPLLVEARPTRAEPSRAVGVDRDFGVWTLDLAAGRATSGPRVGRPPFAATDRDDGPRLDAFGVRGDGRVVAMTRDVLPPFASGDPPRREPWLHEVDPSSGGIAVGRRANVALGDAWTITSLVTEDAVRVVAHDGVPLVSSLHVEPLAAGAPRDPIALTGDVYLPLLHPSGSLFTFEREDGAIARYVRRDPPRFDASVTMATLADVEYQDALLGPRDAPVIAVKRCPGGACVLELSVIERDGARPLARTAAAEIQNFRLVVAGGETCAVTEEGDPGIHAETQTWLRCPQGGDLVRRARFEPGGLFTETVLVGTPSGDVVSMGASAAVVYQKATGQARAVASPLAGRRGPMIAAMADGELLVAGGEAISGSSAAVEALDPRTLTARALDPLRTPRRDGALALLADGRMVVVGGIGPDGAPLASIELRARSGGTTAAPPPLSKPRARHGAVWVTGDRLVVAGGADAASASSVELWDPAAGVVAEHRLDEAHVEPCVVRLASGDVLIAGGAGLGAAPATSFEIVDPRSLAVRRVLRGPAIGACRAARTSNDHVLLVGDLGAWDFDEAQLRIVAAPSPVRTTDLAFARGVEGAVTGFWGDGVSLGPGAFDAAYSARRVPLTGLRPRAVVAGTGDVVAVSEISSNPYAPTGANFIGLQAAAVTWLPRGVVRPRIVSAPATVEAGRPFRIEGARLHASPSVASRAGEAAATPPVVVFRTEGGVLRRARITSIDGDAIEAQLPSMADHAPGWLHVIVDGVPSEGIFVAHRGSPAAGACRGDTECISGFCTDGVCCDARCAGSCVACTRAARGGGDDGVCGPIAAGRDPRDACPTDLGNCRTGACDGAGECARADDGLVCSADARCKGGICTRNGPPAPLPPDRCSDDGLEVVTATGRIACGPYRCAEGRCRAECGFSGDCAPGSYCSARATCEPVRADDEAPLARCSAGGGAPSPPAPVAVLVFPLLAAALRRAARRRRDHHT
jgi:hypothetical protein